MFEEIRQRVGEVMKIDEPLMAEQILSVVPHNHLQHLAKLEIFESLSSTNTYLLEQAKQEPSVARVCFAEEQTAGRGRRGKNWFSPKGANIYCSLLWKFKEQDVSSLGIAVAVMVANVLRQFGIANIGIKWPNDIMFAGRKLGGILLERVQAYVVIGIGLNVFLPVSKDNVLIENAISLEEIVGEKINRNFLAGLLVNELLAKLPVYSEKGLSYFLDDWDKYDVLMNQKINVQTPQEIFSGQMQGINSQGELLLLDEQNELRIFRCGEVSVRSKVGKA